MVEEDKKNIQTSLFHKLTAFALSILPILRIYGWGDFNFGFIITLCLFSYAVLKRSVNVGNIPKLLFVYLIYYLAIWLIEAFLEGDNIFPLGWMKVFIVYYTFFSCIKIKSFLKYYSIVSTICIGFLFFQHIFFIVCGVKISGIATFLPLSFEDDFAKDYLVRISKEGWRMCSFLSEPAECAQFLMPFLAITLFGKDQKKWIKCSFIILAFFLLESGNALIIVALLMGSYFVQLMFSRSSKTKWITLIGIGLIVAIGGSYYISSESGKALMDRQEEVEVDGDSNSSGFKRIIRGYFVYEGMSPFERIFGANNITLITRAQKNCSIPFAFGKEDFYFNTFQNIIIKTGLIGCMLFISMLVSIYKQSSGFGRAIIITMSVIGFIASFLLSYIMLIYLLIAAKTHKNLSFINKKQRNFTPVK